MSSKVVNRTEINILRISVTMPDRFFIITFLLIVNPLHGLMLCSSISFVV